MYKYIYIYIHTYIHTYIHIYTYIYTHIHMRMVDDTVGSREAAPENTLLQRRLASEK